jgi:murein DD-endopeptidase MepM/ murein hydrolase activator NlpD
MRFVYRPLYLWSLVSTFGLASTLTQIALGQTPGKSCPTPALERFQRHTLGSGETIENIAQRYDLTPDSIANMNPGLRNGKVTVGSAILIPPHNGIIIEVARGQTWRELAAKYKVRADSLFELNGCQPPSKIAFIPVGKISQTPASTPVSSTTPNTSPTPATKLGGYPLPGELRVTLPYGWQINPITGDVFFHSGMDLATAVGTPVKAIAPGTVVFANAQGTYGKLVIISHNGGLQTRYAHLENIQVSVGQKVQLGDEIGTVGTTGKPTSKEPHLHFEVRTSSDLGWVAQDPKDYF